MTQEKLKLDIDGIHCNSCKKIIEDSVKELEGIKHVSVNYEKQTCSVSFDNQKIKKETIIAAIDDAGYGCSISDTDEKKNRGMDKIRVLAFILGVIAIALVIYRFSENIAVPEITQNMSYGLLFLVGLLTGFHCISMCGGFVVSYTAKGAKKGINTHKLHMAYGIGKTISYTVIGAAFGLLGSIIAFTPFMRGTAGIIAGLFLIVFGLNMLNVFPSLRKIRLKTPGFIQKFAGSNSGHSSPLKIGLLNGLMLACGPLQAIYIMAAGTGSMIEGAKMLFIFALGTLPVMLGFGYAASIISSSATRKILKVSGIIIIILGLIMMNRGLALTGTGYDTESLIAYTTSQNQDLLAGNGIVTEDGYQVIRMDVTDNGWEPDKFVLKKDVPVKWIINGIEINGCNNAIQVPKLGLEFDIKQGEQTIEFVPDKEGVISWSCWMGMIPGTFIVKSDIDIFDADAVQKELESVPEPAGGSCGGSCGSPTCSADSGSICGCGV